MLAVEPEPKIEPQPNLPGAESFIRTPGDHARRLHGGGRGLATLAVAYPSKGWEETSVPVERIPEIAERFAGVADVYVSMQRFGGKKGGKRRVENLASLSSFYADLDYKDIPELRGRRAKDIYRSVAAYLAERGVPPPTLVISSGHGLHLVWQFRAVKRSALPRWRAAEDWLVQLLEEYGADPAATDPARVLRVVGTRNGFAEVQAIGPVGEVYEFDALCNAILPYTQAEIHDLRVYEAAYRDARDRGAQRRRVPQGAAPEGYGAESLWADRLRDLRDIAEMRPMDDGRARWLAIAAVAASWVSDSPQAMQSECRRLAAEVGGWSGKKADRDLGTISRKMEAAFRGERVQFGGVEADPRYFYSSAKIIRLLEIKPEEQKHLRTLISDDERRRRRREKEESRRRQEGAEPRERYEGRARERAERARQMAAEGSSRAEIAELLGVSKPAVTNYLRADSSIPEGGSKSVSVSCAPRLGRGAALGNANHGESKSAQRSASGNDNATPEQEQRTTIRVAPAISLPRESQPPNISSRAGALGPALEDSGESTARRFGTSEPGLDGEPPAGEESSERPPLEMSIVDSGSTPSPRNPSRRTISDWSAAQGARAASNSDAEQEATSGPRQPAEVVAPEELHYKRLVRHIGQRVRTPRGEGRLWQSFRDRTGVILDSDTSRVAFMSPSQVSPIGEPEADPRGAAAAPS